MSNAATKSETEVIGRITFSAAQKIRREAISNVSRILQLADGIDDSLTRLSVQAACLDIVTGLEDVIDNFRLQSLNSSK